MGLEEFGAKKVDDAQTAAGHLVFVGGADAAAGGADLLAAGRAFRGQFDHAVIRQDDLGAIGDVELLVDGDAEVAELCDFLEEGDGIEDDAVADDAFAAGAENAAGDELEDKFLAADDDGVSGVVAACVTRDGVETLTEHINDLPFAFVAPLGSEHDRCFRSHCLSSLVKAASNPPNTAGQTGKTLTKFPNISMINPIALRGTGRSYAKAPPPASNSSSHHAQLTVGGGVRQ